MRRSRWEWCWRPVKPLLALAVGRGRGDVSAQEEPPTCLSRHFPCISSPSSERQLACEVFGRTITPPNKGNVSVARGRIDVMNSC